MGQRTASIVVALATAMSAHAAAAGEVSLTFATTNVSNIHVNVQVMHPWAKRVNEQGKGVLKVDVRDGFTLANHTNFYTRVLDDVAQISWGIISQVGGKFPRSHVVALPYLADKAEDAAVAWWRLYKSGLLDAEYDEIVPLFFCVIPHAAVHTVKPMPSLDGLNGLKLTMNSKIVSDAITQLGGTPISLPLPAFYEGLQRRTVDGVVIAWSALLPFKLAEVTSYHVEAPLGSTVGVMFMAKKKLESLPPAAQEVLKNNSGERESRTCGAFWDKIVDQGRESIKAMKNHTVVRLNDAQNAAWRKKMDAVQNDWIKSTPDGAKILAKYRELLDQAAAEGAKR